MTRPEHKGRYRVTIYQLGWRLGGKGASGRGPAGRIEEHGLHIWLGFYENAFRLLRECYEELGREPGSRPFASWRDAFIEDSHLGLADRSADKWLIWTMFFPPGGGLPGDPPDRNNPFSMSYYMARAISLLRELLLGVGLADQDAPPDEFSSAAHKADTLERRIVQLIASGLSLSAAGITQALAAVEAAITFLPDRAGRLVLPLVEGISSFLRERLETAFIHNDGLRLRWEIVDLVQSIVVGVLRDGILTDRRGLDSINDYDCREWMRRHGASERSVNGSFVRALYDLAMGYEDGDLTRPGLAAGQALRGCMRMFYGYRGSFFWKMKAGMGDIVFVPFYEVLRKRGVEFKFFHRLTNVGLSKPSKKDGSRHVETLTFDVQATTKTGKPYDPLVRVKDLDCWPSRPDFSQLKGGRKMAAANRDFESHWDRSRAATLTTRVSDDFDFVILGNSIGTIPDTCSEILAVSKRWRDMVNHVKTVETQAFQIWLSSDFTSLGWAQPPVTLSGFEKPFDTWADMTHLAPREDWRETPQAIGYFCGVLKGVPRKEYGGPDYRERRMADVRANAVSFLEEKLSHLLPAAVSDSGFRWEVLVDPGAAGPTKRMQNTTSVKIDSQYWTANVNPSDRYVLALPGTMKYRISPLDRTFDNLTIAGDWTDCGFSQGCVESAVMSGRLAAHAISLSPPLAEIVGYDHP